MKVVLEQRTGRALLVPTSVCCVAEMLWVFREPMTASLEGYDALLWVN